MLAPFTIKHGNLRDTVRMMTEAERQKASLRARAADFDERADLAICTLHRKIEKVYLLEFLIQGVMSIERVVREAHLPGSGRGLVKDLRIRICDERIDLLTCMEAERQGVVEVVMKNARYDDVVVFVCNLAGETPVWLMLHKETGFRRLIGEWLPERYVVVDESNFRDALDTSLRGPQSILRIDAEDVQRRLSRVLDFVTSSRARSSVAIGARRGVSSIGRRLLSAPTKAAGLVRQVLPKGDRAPPLLLQAQEGLSTEPGSGAAAPGAPGE